MKDKLQTLLDNLPKELLPYREKIEATKDIYIPIELEEREDISLTTSKVGGYPYLPMDMEYPVGKDGGKLDFLAQINFAEMPTLKDYPTEGLLQFYIDYEMEIDFESSLDSNIKIIYHKDTNKPYQTKFPKLDEIRKDPAYISPIIDNKEFKMIFKPYEYEFVGYMDFRVENLGITEESTMYKYWDSSFSSSGHKIGGYAFFTQEDPRFYSKEVKKYTKLLLQLDSDNNLCWGDAGVGNFFITEEDLKNRDFSKVMFNWDCH